MAYQETSSLLWILGFIQIASLASAWLARLSEGSRQQASCQWLFLTCLGLMGLSTMASVALGPRYWLTSGTILSVMILGAIWDFQPNASNESF